MKKLVFLVLAAALTLGACASGPTQTKQDAAAAVAAAEHELSRATKANYAWRDTGKLIKKAKAAMDKGDYGQAVKLANQAKRQSINALAQMEENKNAGPRY